jgi:hypothetical protein
MSFESQRAMIRPAPGRGWSRKRLGEQGEVSAELDGDAEGDDDLAGP